MNLRTVEQLGKRTLRPRSRAVLNGKRARSARKRGGPAGLTVLLLVAASLLLMPGTASASENYFSLSPGSSLGSSWSSSFSTPSYSFKTPSYSFKTPSYSFKTPSYSLKTPSYSCGSGSYRNAYGSCTRSPKRTYSFGATAICKDGAYSFSKTRSGTCSWHGGVRRWK